MDKGGDIHSSLLLPICAKCDPPHHLWHLDILVKTPNGSRVNEVRIRQ